jgi:cephalosporin-C deacetylase-like acetyl esterase
MRLFDKEGSAPLSKVNPFIYTHNQADFNLQPVKQNKYRRDYRVEFPVGSAKYYRGGEIARGEYFEPREKGKAPLAILIHGWGDQSVLPLKLMVDGLIKRGIACFILYLPFHSSRLPENKTNLAELTDDEWFVGYQMAVTDVRQIIDWANQNSRIDNQKISIIALSLGAIVSSITMGIDRRIKAAVFITLGGNTGKIMQTNSISRFGNKYRLPQETYLQNQKNYAQYLVEVADKGFENAEPTQRTYLIDPLTYAAKLKERPVLMINALWDELFPRETSQEFQRACGCELVTFPATHAGIWIWYPLIIRKINRFLKFSLADQDTLRMIAKYKG